MSISTPGVKSGPAAKTGPCNHFESILDDLQNCTISVRLVSTTGQELEVVGVNMITHIVCPDGTSYPYTLYKVADIY